ncbi:glutamate--tRNA ligase [Aliifodinibius salipaludis]|uniref:Glutamate--tRNA ligase n=1 Tax=Fodinibius salipaludis TaxID=2032627 RepID=A0A2A2GC73_9BACT|nr:glutamate--tRNA ligase [Aliifodinibius salipaludis]PAU94459.1 glutamate--tRNA ligase [Aliifodinibius salipaludis]
MEGSVRVRFAPSPTGLLHIGGLRTALYNYLFAKGNNGTFVLRIEDTDQARYVEGAEEDIHRSLKWAGMEVDEGPENPGDVGPYRQSERKDMYEQYAEQLVEQGNAYYAFDTPEELDQMRERLKKSGNPSPKYDAITRMSMKNSLTLPEEEVERKLEEGEEYVIRLKVPRRETIRFEDEVRGFVSFESKGLDDQVLLKSDGMPTYHLANVVDDHLMKISHVIRGEEWLSSTPKHILMYEYFGWEPPKMAHLPLIMSPSGGKLSKRKAETEGIPINTKDYIEQKFEPEALVNFLAYLGWSPGDDSEIHSLEELCDLFSLDRVSKGGAVFDYKKLIWYNEHYLREKPADELWPRVQEIAKEHDLDPDEGYMKQIIPLMKERVSKVEDFVTMGRFFFEDPEEYEDKAVKKWKDNSAELLEAYVEKIEELDGDDFEAKTLKDKIKEVIEEYDVGFGPVMMPLRVAVSGMGYGPDLTPTIELLGKETTIRRINTAIERLG